MDEATALTELRKGSGTQFDPELVEKFAQMIQASHSKAP